MSAKISPLTVSNHDLDVSSDEISTVSFGQGTSGMAGRTVQYCTLHSRLCRSLYNYIRTAVLICIARAQNCSTAFCHLHRRNLAWRWISFKVGLSKVDNVKLWWFWPIWVDGRFATVVRLRGSMHLWCCRCSESRKVNSGRQAAEKMELNLHRRVLFWQGYGTSFLVDASTKLY